MDEPLLTFEDYRYLSTVLDDPARLIAVYAKEIDNPYLEEGGWEYVIVQWSDRTPTVLSRFKNGESLLLNNGETGLSSR